MSGISANIDAINERIVRAEARSGRSLASVRLMAVSKFHPADDVLEAIGAGQILFGENRVQEADSKFPDIISAHPEVELHLIGSLQRNKVAKIARMVSCIQSVDREELLAEISKQCALLGRTIDVLFEYHTAEDSKSGYAAKDSLFRSLDLLGSMPNVRCRGLMTMAPFTDEEHAIRSSFRSLVSLRDECAKRYPSLDFSVLSMGMSADFEIAIEEGSTLVRVGTAIFGERQ